MFLYGSQHSQISQSQDSLKNKEEKYGRDVISQNGDVSAGPEPEFYSLKQIKLYC